MRKIKLFLSLLMVMLLSVGNVWATTASLTITSKPASSSENLTDDQSNTWAFTSDGTVSGSETNLIHVGTNSSQVSYIQLLSSGLSSQNISSITVYGAAKANTNVTIKVYIGTNLLGTSSVLGNTSSSGGTEFTVENTNNYSGEVKILISRPSKANGAIYFNSANVTYSAGGDVIVKTLKSIAVTGQTTEYEVGDDFSFDGTCTATYSVTKNNVQQQDEEKVVTPTSVSSPDMTSDGQKEVTVTYADATGSQTVKYNITVNTHTITPGEYAINLNNTFFGVATGNNGAEQTKTKNDVTFVAGCVSTAQNKTYYDAGHVRFYTDSYLHISVPSGYRITSIVFTAGGTWNGGISANVGSYAANDKTWSGKAQEVEFSFTQQDRIATATVTFEVDAPETACETPTFDPAAGEYEEAQNVTISCATEDATIYYTIDGTNPKESVTKSEYTGAISVTETKTIKAYATKTGLLDSEVAEAEYTFVAGPEVILDFTTNDEWEFPTEKTVDADEYTAGGYTITVAGTTGKGYNFDTDHLFLGQNGAYITLPTFDFPVSKVVCVGVESGSGSVTFNLFEGSTPVSTAVTSCKVDQTFEIDEENQASNKTYTIKLTNANNARFAKIKVYRGVEPAVVKPVISGEENFVTSTEVTITCETTGAAIYYTTNGDDPKVSGITSPNPFNLTSAATVKAAAKLGDDWSAIVEKTFTKITPITVAQALSAASGANVYVTGTITSITEVSIQHKNATYVISDVTAGIPANEMIIYRGKYVDGADFDSEDQIHVGDVVVVSGTIGVYQEKNQLAQGNQIVTISAPAVAAPVFDPNGGGFMGETDVTITCATASSTIYYTLDGTNPTNLSTLYEGAIHLNATTTITAIAYVGEESSLVVAKEFTLTAPMTVAEAYDALTEDDINNAAVTGIVYQVDNISNGHATYWISDNGEAGEKVLEVFNGYGLNGASIAAGGIQEGDEVTVFGNLTIFNSTTKEFASGSRLLAFNRPVVPSISADPVAVDAAAHAAQSVTITYENWGAVSVADAEATLWDNEACDEAFSGDWISNISFGDPYTSVSFDIAANTGAARTAYMKIYALGDDVTTEAEKVIAISQEAYVAPAEPASLPFAFAGGRDDIENKQGMSQEGLGTDYSSGDPTTKLKFDNTGDWVIINIASDPGKLTYDIQGNGFSGGTFKVQESVNGVDYTDVATYTELGAKASEEKTLAQTTRFVKFIYTNKGSGNVGLGNIGIAEYVAPAPVEAPEISGDESFLNSVEVTLTCATDGATIYYTIDDSDPKESTTTGTSFNLTDNATVRAIAKLGDDWSNEATPKTFTKIIPYTTIAGLAEDMTNTATPVYITLGNWQVSVVKNSQAFVTDGENGLIIYQSNHGLKEGDVLSGTIQCNLVNYNDVVELTGVKKGETSGLTVTDGTINPIVKTIAEANALTVLNTGLLIKLENVTYNEGEFEDEDNNTIAPYTTFYDYSSDLEDGKKYNITGIIQKYQSAIQIYPRKQADIQEVADASAPETPTFSPEGGVYTEAQSVIITCATEGATIYYTTDGSTPDNTKTLYEGAINVEATTTIKAIAIKDDKSSVVASATFTINIPEDESVSKTWDLSIASYDANPTVNQVKWSATYVNMVVDKYNATTKANNYLGGDANNRTSSRFYQNSKLTITPNGKEITSVVFTATSTGYANALQGSEWTNASASVDGTTVTVTPTDGKNAISAVIGGTCGFTAVQVNYKNIAPEPPTADYTRDGLTAGNYATICLPNGGTISGATLFDLDYYDGDNTLYLLEVNGNAMVAGRPYVFLPSGTSIEVFYTDDANEPAGSYRGLVGSYTVETVTANVGNYILYQNAYYLVNSQARVGANRAYIHMEDVPTAPQQQQGAPRRRVAMSVHGEQVATGIDALNASDAPAKVLINGQLFIIRGEKMFDAKGQLVK